MAPKALAQTLREKVIKAAVKYVADNGPDGLSFRQIAADAGVSHQAPYHHFGDRSAIFNEIALEGFKKFSAAISGPARVDEDREICVRLCERYVDFAIANKGHFRVWQKRYIKICCFDRFFVIPKTDNWFAYCHTASLNICDYSSIIESRLKGLTDALSICRN